MNTEDEEFNRIEREANLRKEAVRSTVNKFSGGPMKYTPNYQIDMLCDIFGGYSIVVDGRVLVQINYVAPYIDNAGISSLAKEIMGLIKPAEKNGG